MTGHTEVAKAIELQRNVSSALASVKFLLRKYQSNSKEFLKQIDPKLIATSNSKLLGAESFIFVLGLVWYTETDGFSVSLNCNEIPNVITKRIVLSVSSKVFDVLGILSPVIVRAKLILQDLWREKLKWDDPISENLRKKFLSYYNDLKKLTNFSIDRRLSAMNVIKEKQLIGFCDASTRAYCAVVYQRSMDLNGNTNIRFVRGKTRVAPLKVLRISRLELMFAVMLSQLVSRITSNLEILERSIVLFSDSTAVLSWLKTLPTS